MDVPEQQPDPDGGDGPGHEPGGSPQDELDFSILFDYDYLNPIEGRWRLPPPGPRALAGDTGLGTRCRASSRSLQQGLPLPWCQGG